MFISVIITSFNRADALRRALSFLYVQTTPAHLFEVIVVDDGSTDGTGQLCQELSHRMQNLNYVYSKTNLGCASARNLGIQSAKGSHILFTDDDCLPDKCWIGRMTKALEREPIVAGAIASPTNNFMKLCHNIAQFHPFMPGKKRGFIPFIAGANMGFRRSVLEDVQGFQEAKRFADDMELILRARARGYRIYFEPKAIVVHDPERTTLSALLKYAARHASETIKLRQEYRLLLRTPFILQSPFLILLTAPLIALNVTLRIYLLNLSLMKRFWAAPIVVALKLAWCWGAARGLRDRETEEKSTDLSNGREA